MPASGLPSSHLAHQRISFVLPLSVPTKPEEHEMGQGFPARSTKYKNSHLSGADSVRSNVRDGVCIPSISISISSVASAVSNCIMVKTVFLVQLYFWSNCISRARIFRVCVCVSITITSVAACKCQTSLWPDRSSCCVPPPTTTTLCNMFL